VNPAAVRSFLDVPFHRPAGHRPLTLDLYVPATEPAALCVYAHGGGWRTGTRSDGPGPAARWQPSFFHRVAGLGLAIASIDYRLSGEATFPAQLEDIAAAVAFLAAARAGFGVSTTRTVAWGVSAGGHLAALLALDAISQHPLDAVVCWYPPTDLRALPDDVDAAGGTGDRGPGARESLLIGAALGERPDLADAASPVHRVHPGAPPFLFVHGTGDRLVPPRQSHRLADALRAAGGRADVELVDGAGHQFTGLPDADLAALVTRSVRFLTDPEHATARHSAPGVATTA
jgi:acetyl esterase/lipase